MCGIVWLICIAFVLAILLGMERYLIVVFCIYLMTSEWASLTCWFPIGTSSLVKCHSFRLLIFSPWVVFLIVEFESSLYVLSDKSFIDYVIWKYFLPSLHLSFSFSTLSFTEQTLILMKSNLSTIFVYYVLLYQRTLCLRYVHEDFLL